MKKFQLILMAYVQIIVGALLSILGTTIPDLRCLFNVNLKDLAALFLPLGLTYGAAGLLSIVLLKQCNIYLLIAVTMLLYNVGVAVVALSQYIYLAWIGLFAAGLSSGIAVNCCLVLCSVLYRDEPYAFHVLAASVSCGSFVGPLLAKPFLGQPRSDLTLSRNVSWNISLDNSSSRNSSIEDEIYCDTMVSKVMLLYIIIAVLGLPSVFGFLGLYFGREPEFSKDHNHNQYVTFDKRISLAMVIFTGLILLCFPCAYGLSYSFGSYLTTIGVDGHLQLGIERTSVMTSVFWLMFLMGRVISTLVSVFIKQQTIMYVCLVGQIAATCLLFLLPTLGEIILWIGALSLSFFNAPSFACLLAWSREYISLTPCILSVYCLMDAVGFSFLPYISGVFVSLYGENALYYFTCAVTIFEFVLFSLGHCIGYTFPWTQT